MGGFIPIRLSVLSASGGSSGVPTGSGAADRVAIWSSTSTLSSTASFTCSLSTGVVTIDKNLVVINSSTNNITFVAPTAAPFIVKSLTGNSNGLRLYSNTATDVASVINGYNANLELGANNTVFATISGAGAVTLGAASGSQTHVVNGDGLNLTGSSGTSEFSVFRAGATGLATFAGGSGGTAAKIALYGQTHATKASVTEFYNNNVLVGSISVGGAWTLGASANANSFIFNTDNNQFKGSTSTGTVYINRGTTAAILRIGGGTGADGGEIGFFGSAHATAPNEIRFYNNGTLAGIIDTNSMWTIGTGTSTTHRLNITVQTTVGAAGGASALPLTPTGYVLININGTNRAIPYYASA